ncbi:MAG: hypothetical protein A2086_14205 [Spirochaetes bacterium GWD1_27_9]|nr:MAG: hypothetical protein A2Z98_09315 [Spirochaetes bacterium GWB1_27_13]OHD23680.1 MAG: hypothetical protein A2Y34_15455 [Spirochaetes bacterium GWC1_27_15]OHD29877.1 MAG: hypothetical protein A2086_14205 [Spirochaetes bacterium GWD1_27_9]
MEQNILLEIIKFCGISIASGVLGNASYDLIKKLPLKKLKDKLIPFIKEYNDIDKFIKIISENQIQYSEEPFKNIEFLFKNIIGDKYNPIINEKIKEWINENRKDIEIILNPKNYIQNNGFNIGKQKAGKNIINIQGNYSIKK